MKAFIVPHPPIMVPEVGGAHLSEIKRTVSAMKRLGERMKKESPQAVIVISPHSPMFGDAFAIKTVERLTGSLLHFSAPEVSFEWETDEDLADAILSESKKSGVTVVSLDEQLSRTYGIDLGIDHGVMAPMYYVFSDYKCPVVLLSISGLPLVDHYRFGMSIRKAVEGSKKNVVFVASGDLSHRLTKDAPAGYNPNGKEFDKQVIELFKKGDLAGLLSIEENLVEDAGECGLRSYVVMAGLMDGFEVEADIMSYEGPFGVGYPVGVVSGDEPTDGKWKDIIRGIEEERKKRLAQECLPVKIARQAVEVYIKENRIPSPPEDVPEYMRCRAGVFVSLKKGNVLRGCIGTVEPMQKTLAEEITRNAVSAATQDMRFEPISEEELTYLTYSVDILNEAEPVSDPSCLDPEAYGVIVESGHRRGLLLPDIEGVRTVEEQLSIAKRKAGIKDHESCTINRFTVTRYR